MLRIKKGNMKSHGYIKHFVYIIQYMNKRLNHFLLKASMKINGKYVNVVFLKILFNNMNGNTEQA